MLGKAIWNGEMAFLKALSQISTRTYVYLHDYHKAYTKSATSIITQPITDITRDITITNIIFKVSAATLSQLEISRVQEAKAESATW